MHVPEVATVVFHEPIFREYDLVTPVADATMTPDSATALHSSIIMSPPPRLAVFDSEDHTAPPQDPSIQYLLQEKDAPEEKTAPRVAIV